MRFLSLGTLSFFFLAGAAQATSPSAALQPEHLQPMTCGGENDGAVNPVAFPLPSQVSGRVAFYLAEYDPKTVQVLKAWGLGNINEVHPLASSYKGLLVEALLRDVEAGRLSLEQEVATTPANRSIEDYPAGVNSLGALAARAIKLSDNTAADILQLTYGPDRFARFLKQKSACTNVLLTTKAMWAAQAGFLSDQLGPDRVAGTANYAALPFDDRVQLASQLIQDAQQYQGPAIDIALDQWYQGSRYTPQVDLDVQPTSTAKAMTDLVAHTYAGANLGPTKRLYREIMATGCCRPKKPKLKFTYWGAKAGSGWRILTMTGYVEVPDGRVFAYTYLNDLSNTRFSGQIEQQLRPVTLWIENLLLTQSHH